MILERIPAIQQLTTAEKFQLWEELWNVISANPDDIPVTAYQVAEAERHLAMYEQDPTQTVPWEVVYDRLKRKPRSE